MSTIFRRLMTGAAWAVFLLLVPGCVAVSGGSGGPRIAELNMFGLPAAIDMDGRRGADGIGIRVFASPPDSAKGVEIRSGRLDILMFDGPAKGVDIRADTPLKVWSFEPRALAGLSGTSALGIGYEFALRWGTQRPRSRVITVFAVYHPPSGAEILSAPVSVSVGPG
jgi:hypothetical protein